MHSNQEQKTQEIEDVDSSDSMDFQNQENTEDQLTSTLGPVSLQPPQQSPSSLAPNNQKKVVTIIPSIDEFIDQHRGKSPAETYFNYFQQFAQQNFQQIQKQVRPYCYEKLSKKLKKDINKLEQAMRNEVDVSNASGPTAQTLMVKKISKDMTYSSQFQSSGNDTSKTPERVDSKIIRMRTDRKDTDRPLKSIQEEVQNTQVYIQVKPIFVEKVQQILVMTWERYRLQDQPFLFKYTKTLRIYDLQFQPIRIIECEVVYSRFELPRMSEVSVLQADQMIFFFKRVYDKEVSFDNQFPGKALNKGKKSSGLNIVPSGGKDEAEDAMSSKLVLHSYTICRSKEEQEKETEKPWKNCFLREEKNQKYNPVFLDQFDLDRTQHEHDSFKIRDRFQFDDKFVYMDMYNTGTQSIYDFKILQLCSQHKESEQLSSDNVWLKSILSQSDSKPTIQQIDFQFALSKKLDRDADFKTYLFIIVAEYSQVHIKVKISEVENEKESKPTLLSQNVYSSYQFLKIKNPRIEVYRANLIDKDQFNNFRKFCQYYIVNSRYQIQLIYPFYDDNTDKFRITDLIKQKYKIDYILEDDKFMKVDHISFRDRGTLEYSPNKNIIRTKQNMMQQLNQVEIDWFKKDKNIVVQLVIDGINQQIVYVQNYKEPTIMAIFLKDLYTEENFVRKPEITEAQVIQRIEDKQTEIKKAKSMEERKKAFKSFFNELRKIRRQKTSCLSNMHTKSRYAGPTKPGNLFWIDRKFNSDHINFNTHLKIDSLKVRLDNLYDKQSDNSQSGVRLLLQNKTVHDSNLKESVNCLDLIKTQLHNKVIIDDPYLTSLLALGPISQKSLQKLQTKAKSDPEWTKEDVLSILGPESSDHEQLVTKVFQACCEGGSKDTVTPKDWLDNYLAQETDRVREAILNNVQLIDDEHLEKVAEKVKLQVLDADDELQQHSQELDLQLHLKYIQHAGAEGGFYLFVVTLVTHIKNFKYMSFILVKRSFEEVRAMAEAATRGQGRKQTILSINPDNPERDTRYPVVANAGEGDEGGIKKATLTQIAMQHLLAFKKDEGKNHEHGELKGSLEFPALGELRGVQYKPIWLHFEDTVEPYQEGCRHLAFIYDEYNNLSHDMLCFYSLHEEKIVAKQLVTQRQEHEKYVYSNKLDLQVFKLCRTSQPEKVGDPEKEKLSKPNKTQQNQQKQTLVNYQLYIFYTNKLGLVEIQEYQFQYPNSPLTDPKPSNQALPSSDNNYVCLFGIKNIYLSHGMMESVNFERFTDMKVFPYIHPTKNVACGVSINFENIDQSEQKADQMQSEGMQRIIDALDAMDDSQKHLQFFLVEEYIEPHVYFLKGQDIDKEKNSRYKKELRDFVAKYPKYIAHHPWEDVKPEDQSQKDTAKKSFSSEGGAQILQENQSITLKEECLNSSSSDFLSFVTKLRAFCPFYQANESKMYHFDSQVVKTGHKKLLLSNEASELPEFLLVVSARLKEEHIRNQNFNHAETVRILSSSIQLLNQMRLPTMENMIVKSFRQMVEDESFFKSQTCLHGLSICELGMNDPNMIQMALSRYKGNDNKETEFTILEDIVQNDSDRRQALIELEIVMQQQLLALDFNMDTTLYRGIKFKAVKSVQLMIDFIINDVSNESLSNLLIYDLPEIFEMQGITIHKFFSTPKRQNGIQDTSDCNIRKPLKNFRSKDKLNNFSNMRQQLIVVDKHLIDDQLEREKYLFDLVKTRDKIKTQHEVNWATEVLRRAQEIQNEQAAKAAELDSVPVKTNKVEEFSEDGDQIPQTSQVDKDPNTVMESDVVPDKSDSDSQEQSIEGGETQNENSFAVTTWFIDFEYMILGQKIKKLNCDGKRTNQSLKDLKFTHLFYSDLILKNQENRLFMQQETVKKLIEFQFDQSKNFFRLTLFIYLFMFLIPYFLSVMNKETDRSYALWLYEVCACEEVFSFAFFILKVCIMLLNDRPIAPSMVLINLFHTACFVIIYVVDGGLDSIQDGDDLLDEAFILPFKILMVALCFAKFYEQIRVFDYLSYFLYLFVRTIIDIRHKLLIFVLFQYFFAISFVAMEVEPDPEFDATHLSQTQKIFTLCWFNSLAKLKKFGYSKFAAETPDGFHKNFHIAVIYGLYFMHVVSMFIMLLNMMVAVINSAYIEIDQYKSYFKFKFKAQLNNEFFLVFKHFKNLTEFSSLIFTSELEISQNPEMEQNLMEVELINNLKQVLSKNENIQNLHTIKSKLDEIIKVQERSDAEFMRTVGLIQGDMAANIQNRMRQTAVSGHQANKN